MSRRCAWSVGRALAALCCAASSVGAGAALAQAPRTPVHHYALDHGSGAAPVIGLHAGMPTAFSVLAGLDFGLGRRVPGALFVAGETGVLGNRICAGWLATRGPHEGFEGTAHAARVTVLRARATEFGMTRGHDYLGVELQRLNGLYFGPRVGLFREVARPRWVASLDVSIGY
jgi:hypothetical protein